MSTLSVGGATADRDALLDLVLERSAAADAGEIWRLALAWRGLPARGELHRAALGLAVELGRRAAARDAMGRAATRILRSPGCATVATHLPGVSISYGVQTVAADAALAVVLCDQLSAEVRDALAGPWGAVFGDPFAAAPFADASFAGAPFAGAPFAAAPFADASFAGAPFAAAPNPTGDVPAE
jgi:hypothetical protein